METAADAGEHQRMRLFRLLTSLLAVVAPLAPLHAEWEVKASKDRPATSPAITHRIKTVQSRAGGGPLDLHLVVMDRSKTTLRVLDLPEGGSVAEGLRQNHALAGVNGGYFQPGRAPLGLVVSNGVRLHPFQRAKILSGLVIVTPRGATLMRTAEYKGGANIKEALQAGPFLVDRGNAVSGLNATRPAERTVLLADKKGVVALLVTESITLAELGQLLATPGIFPEVKIERALNLDGGSSTALWVNGTPSPFSHREWKRVRNVLAVMPKN